MKKIKDWFLSFAIGKGFLTWLLTMAFVIATLVMLTPIWPICGPIYSGIAIYYFWVVIATIWNNYEKAERGETIEL